MPVIQSILSLPVIYMIANNIEVEYKILLSKENFDKLSNLYPNKIFIKRIKHKGVSVARNYALKKASGDYFVFLDSDDYIKGDLFKHINENANKGIDVFVGEFDSISEDPKNLAPLECEIMEKEYIDNKSQEEVLNYSLRKNIYSLYQI